MHLFVLLLPEKQYRFLRTSLSVWSGGILQMWYLPVHLTERKRFPQECGDFIFPLLKSQHHISGKYNCHMGYQCIVRQTVAFANQIQIWFAGLEKYLDLPAFSINADDFFLRKIRVTGTPFSFWALHERSRFPLLNLLKNKEIALNSSFSS